jgi:hypothetical protein
MSNLDRGIYGAKVGGEKPMNLPTAMGLANMAHKMQ